MLSNFLFRVIKQQEKSLPKMGRKISQCGILETGNSLKREVLTHVSENDLMNYDTKDPYKHIPLTQLVFFRHNFKLLPLTVSSPLRLDRSSLGDGVGYAL